MEFEYRQDPDTLLYKIILKLPSASVKSDNYTFTSSPTQAQFRFTKRLEGKTLEANAFTFELLENNRTSIKRDT